MRPISPADMSHVVIVSIVGPTFLSAYWLS